MEGGGAAGGWAEWAANCSWPGAPNASNGSLGPPQPSEPEGTSRLLHAALKAALLGLLILCTVVGNVFVIAAILLERHLQQVANRLILSLAVADLLVACLVMPLGAVYEVAQRWTLGPELCDMWTSSDVLCCTASILHLVAIALDRYWAVTNVDYIHHRTARRVGAMILGVWGASFTVCVAPVLGWKDPEWHTRVARDLQCTVSQDLAYQLFATVSSFYLPLLVILVLYWRIFQAARSRIRRRAGQGALAAGGGGIAAAVVCVIGRPLPTVSEATTTTTTTAAFTASSANCSPERAAPEDEPARRKPDRLADSRREKKAAKTLAIITGAFVVCWLPFFTLAIVLPACDCRVSPHLVSFSLWLGYFNSTLNPVIYTVFSPEFRHAFQRLLCGRRGALRRRRRLAARHFH